MPSQQLIQRRATGLNLQWNPFLTGEGSLKVANNCVIDREGVIERRRGFQYVGTKLAAAGATLMDYKDHVHVLDGTTLKYDPDYTHTWTSHSGSFSAPDASTRMRGVEVRGAFYFTTSNGLYKKDALATEPVKAGLPQPVDWSVSLVGTGSSAAWMSPDTKVRYRLVFERTDANNFDIQSAPSFALEIANPLADVVIDWGGGRAIVTHTAHGLIDGGTVTISSADDASYEGTYTITVTNADTYTYQLLTQPSDTTDVAAKSGANTNVRLDFTLPDDLAAGDKFVVYRSVMSASATTSPGDRLFKFFEQAIIAAEITAGTAFMTDIYDETYLDTELYTNATQETILKANDRPPFAKDVALFQGNLFLANTKVLHFKELELKTITGLTAGTSTITITDGTTTRTYTAASAEDVATQQFLLSTAESTTAGNIVKTAQSLVKVVNQDSGQSAWYGYYTADVDDPPGKLLFRARDLTQVAFSFTANSAVTGNSFEPNVPTSGTAVQSENETKQNRLYRAKFEQPDHVPASNYDDIGSEDDPILRIAALRDSLLIFKDEDGVYRLSGTTEDDFVISQLDPTIRLLAEGSVAVLNNAAYAFTTQGVVRVDENGTAIVSRPIEDELMKIISWPNYRTLTHSVAYERERKYLLWTLSASTDTVATIAWCYNWLTGAWTRWLLPCSSAVTSESDSAQDEKVLYVAHADYEFVLQQRKTANNTTTDYMDQLLSDSTVTIDVIATKVNVFGNTVSLVDITYSTPDNALVEGFVLQQGAVNARVVLVTALGGDTYRLELDENYTGSLSVAAANLIVNIPAEVEWQPEPIDNPLTLKQFPEVAVYMERDVTKFHELGFKTDATPAQTFLRQIRDDTASSAVTPIRAFVPQAYQRARTLSLTYRNLYARETFEIVGMSMIARIVGHRVTRAPV